MTTNTGPGTGILCNLRSARGNGIVQITDRFDTDIDDLWSALTDPDRLARWIGQVEGDLRPGSDLNARFTSGWEGTVRVKACEPPRRLLVLTTQAGTPDQVAIEATLTTDGDQTILAIEERGTPLNELANHGTGWQIHIEDLTAHIAERQRCDIQTRWGELLPAYLDLAANAGQQD